MIILIEDARIVTPNKGSSFCNKGIRLFCKKYDLDFDDFRKNGIEEHIIIALNDSMGLQVVEAAHGRSK